MINNSKILTVSYGTFSCTLEGFDDSFGTMKAIAEYFRDLAADDRYFGAEPPTPDAEMLARIAEREIARRVQAHEDGGKIVLRAEEPAPAALPAEPAAQAAPAPAAPTMEAPAPAPVAPAAAPSFTAPMPMPGAPTVYDEAQAEAEAPAEPAEAPAEEPVSDADFAANIAALTAEDQSDTAEAEGDAPEVSDAEIETSEAETAEADAADEADVEAPVAEDVTTDEEAAETPAEMANDLAADFAEEIAEDTAEEMPSHEVADMTETPAMEPVEPAEVPHPDPDSVAAKLRRIRSVVAQSEQGYGDTDYSEDEHAQDFLDDAAADLDAALALDDAAEQGLVEDEAEADITGETDALLADVATHADDEAEVQSPEVAMPAEDEAPQAEFAEEEPQAEAADESTEIEDTLAQLLADAMPDTADNDESDMSDDEADDVADTAYEAEDEAERPLDARVVKMKRSVLEEAIEAGELTEEGSDEDTVNLFSDEAEDDFDNALSPEEEAELQRELAEVEADFAPAMDADEDDAIEAEDVAEEVAEAQEDDEDDDTFDMAEDELQEALDDASTAAGRGVDRLQAVERTSDVARIFDEADNHRDDADSSARRNAIQHLRAAVAATRAEKNAGVDISKDKDDSVYRSDLADMVRPRRPRADGGSRSERPAERPAPLKLVAEQRIDTPREPVQPRRIRTSDITDEAMQATGDTSGSFADFAEEMGAGSLPELLEAAAAYMADVEGRPQFSRPMLMGKLKEVEGDGFSREDGLRSFGQLLRQGKLQKLKGGRFAVTDETEFRAEARNVG